MIQTLVACYAFARTARGRGLCVGDIGMMLSMTARQPSRASGRSRDRMGESSGNAGSRGRRRACSTGRQQAKEAEHKAAEECRRAAELAFQRDARNTPFAHSRSTARQCRARV